MLSYSVESCAHEPLINTKKLVGDWNESIKSLESLNEYKPFVFGRMDDAITQMKKTVNNCKTMSSEGFFQKAIDILKNAGKKLIEFIKKLWFGFISAIKSMIAFFSGKKNAKAKEQNEEKKSDAILLKKNREDNNEDSPDASESTSGTPNDEIENFEKYFEGVSYISNNVSDIKSGIDNLSRCMDICKGNIESVWEITNTVYIFSQCQEKLLRETDVINEYSNNGGTSKINFKEVLDNWSIAAKKLIDDTNRRKLINLVFDDVCKTEYISYKLIPFDLDKTSSIPVIESKIDESSEEDFDDRMFKNINKTYLFETLDQYKKMSIFDFLNIDKHQTFSDGRCAVKTAIDTISTMILQKSTLCSSMEMKLDNLFNSLMKKYKEVDAFTKVYEKLIDSLNDGAKEANENNKVVYNSFIDLFSQFNKNIIATTSLLQATMSGISRVTNKVAKIYSCLDFLVNASNFYKQDQV